MPQLTSEEFAEIESALARMEVPDECLSGTEKRWHCGCPKKRIDCGCPDETVPLPCRCADYARFGKCACQAVYPEPCRCTPVFEPCPHVLSRNWDDENGITVAQWSALLRGVAARRGHVGDMGYEDPPPPRSGHCAKSRKARVCVLARRHADGFGLWHPDDIREEDLDHVAIDIVLAGNGRPKETDKRLSVRSG